MANNNPSWLNRPDEVVIEKETKTNLPDGMVSLFDSVYDTTDREHSFSQLTIREVSEYYQFSVDYIGDYVVQLGAQSPVDIDTKLSELLEGKDIFALLEAVTTLDPYDSNIGYDSISIPELSEELNIPVQSVLNICMKYGFNLPYGTETMLHASVVEKIREIQDFESFSSAATADDYIKAIDVTADEDSEEEEPFQ